MSDRSGLFTGSFDPITIGHVQLIERASRLFDRVYVGIFYNPEKVGLFSIEQRVRMVEGALAHLENVEIVTSTQELAVTVARNLGVPFLPTLHWIVERASRLFDRVMSEFFIIRKKSDSFPLSSACAW